MRRIGSSARVATVRQANRVSTPPAIGLRPIDPGPFALRHEPIAVPRRLRAGRRRARPAAATRSGAAARRSRRGSRSGLIGGFQWDREDSTTKDWYPQGIDGRGDLLLVSWYSKRDGAARLSVVDTAAGRYGHVALVTTDGKPVKTHAGGLAWREDLLYVADTTRGLRVFDLTRFSGATLPQAGWYRPVEKGLRFSYASVDEAAGSLLVGEYTDKVPGARLVRWPFAPGGLLAQEPASDAWLTAHANLQGAVVLGGQLLMAASRGAASARARSPRRRSPRRPSTGAGRPAARTSRASAARSSRSPSTPTCRGRWRGGAASSRPLARPR